MTPDQAAERDELADIILDVGEYIPGSHADDYVSPNKAADAILAAGYRKTGSPTMTPTEECRHCADSPTALPGNPHYEAAVSNRYAGDMRFTEATLAVAWEQRTANLIAYAQMRHSDPSTGAEAGITTDAFLSASREAAERLGL